MSNLSFNFINNVDYRDLVKLNVSWFNIRNHDSIITNYLELAKEVIEDTLNKFNYTYIVVNQSIIIMIDDIQVAIDVYIIPLFISDKIIINTMQSLPASINYVLEIRHSDRKYVLDFMFNKNHQYNANFFHLLENLNAVVNQWLTTTNLLSQDQKTC